MDIFVKTDSLVISPKTTIKEVKNMLEARGLINPKIIFGNGEILSPVVFQTTQYDNVDFTGHANVLAGSYVLAEPKQKLETVPIRITAPAPILTPLTPLPPLPGVLTTPTTPLTQLPAVLTTPTTPLTQLPPVLTTPTTPLTQLPPVLTTPTTPLPPLQPVQPQPVVAETQQDLINMKTGNYFPTTPVTYTKMYDEDRPFSVTIVGNRVTVQSTLRYLNLTASKIFVGTTPINGLTRYYQTFEIGSTFVLQNTKDADINLYWFVGYEIFQFRTYKPLIYYTSPLTDIFKSSFPWAQDEDGNIYLFNIKTIMIGRLSPDVPIEEKDQFDPYDLFILNLETFEVQNPYTGDKYEMQWDPNPEEQYDQFLNEGYHPGLELGKDLWVSNMKRYGLDNGLRPLNITN